MRLWLNCESLMGDDGVVVETEDGMSVRDLLEGLSPLGGSADDVFSGLEAAIVSCDTLLTSFTSSAILGVGGGTTSTLAGSALFFNASTCFARLSDSHNSHFHSSRWVRP